MAKSKEFRLVRDGDVQVTSDPKRAVALQFDGYVEEVVEPTKPAEAPKPKP